MKSDIVHIGVDVSKERLDIYNPITNTASAVPNTVEGFRKLRDMARKARAVVCCEPTGGFEIDLIRFLQKFKVQAAFCDGFRVRHFALSTGEFSKNDKVDAKMISRFADCQEIRILTERDESELRLKSYWNNYQTFVDMHAILAQKAFSEHDGEVKALLRKESARLRKEADRFMEKCVGIAEGDARMKRLFETFLLVAGIGRVTAIAVIVGMPELGKVGDAAAAKLAGVAPMDRQSGNSDRGKRIQGGRRDVRNALYMASVSAVKCNPILRSYYLEVKRRMPGPKATKWALTPVMRKILHLMNKIARNPNFRPQTDPKKSAS